MDMESQALELYLTSPGSVSHLDIRAQDRQHLRKLAASHLELSVQAAGLNFRDVLNILNLDPTCIVQPLGLECASVASSVGSSVTHVCSGDLVYGFAMGCLASNVRTDAHIQVHMPRSLSFEEACTLPILWCTIRVVAEAMRSHARQHILIHATTGGVGLVALEHAHHCGVVVAGSIGRPFKVGNVRMLGVARVATSRDALTFVRGMAVCLAGWRLHAVVSVRLRMPRARPPRMPRARPPPMPRVCPFHMAAGPYKGIHTDVVGDHEGGVRLPGGGQEQRLE